MSLFLTVPLVGLAIYTAYAFNKWDKKLQSKPRAVVEVKSQEPEIPDNIDWERPDWSEFGMWTGTGGGKFGPITVVRPRLQFILDVSPSRGAGRPETANFRLINIDDTGIQNLIGGMRAPGKYIYDSYEHRKKRGWPAGRYTLQVEVQGTPNWRVVGLEDLQFPEPPKPKVTTRK